MGLLVGLGIVFILVMCICDGNVGLSILVMIGLMVVVAVFECQKENETKTKRAPQDADLEKTIYTGLYDDWMNHEKQGNHFVPKEYVKYMERNEKQRGFYETAWECWAKARTNEILIAKGYQGTNMKCLSEYDQFQKCRVDHSNSSALYENFNAKFLPLIEFYNKTGEYIPSIKDLPSVTAQQEAQTKTVLDEFRIDGSGVSKTPTGRKKYFDTAEILNDIRQQYGEHKYNIYHTITLNKKRTQTDEQVFNELCNLCEKNGMLNIVASEQKYQDVSAKLSAASSKGSWLCPDCKTLHNGSDILCACGMSKYKALEIKMFKGIEENFGKEIKDKTKKEYDWWCDKDGRLGALNQFYPRYEIALKALKDNDNVQIIFDSLELSAYAPTDYNRNRLTRGKEYALPILYLDFLSKPILNRIKETKQIY